MKILRIGGTSVSYTRYLDLLENHRIDKLILMVERNSSFQNGIKTACDLVDLPLSQRAKLNIYTYKSLFPHRIINLGLSAVKRYADRVFITPMQWSFFDHIGSLLLRNWPWPTLQKVLALHRPDIIWSGSNDFDGSNVVTWGVIQKHLGIPIVRSYKEHRHRYLIDEKHALLGSDALILPSIRNVEAFERIYRTMIKNKTLIADEDWRYSGLIRFMERQNFKKLSSIDGVPHIVILSGVVTYGKKDFRRNSRYNYLAIIKELLAQGAHVHLHTRSIIESTQRPITAPDNPYAEICKTHSNFHIEPPLNLETNWDDYILLGKYDAGILHNYIHGEPITSFTEMNVPNRLFEYQLAGVMPIVLAGMMLDVESIIKDTAFGLILSSYSEAVDVLYNDIVSNNRILRPLSIKSFKDFTNTLLRARNL